MRSRVAIAGLYAAHPLRDEVRKSFDILTHAGASRALR